MTIDFNRSPREKTKFVDMPAVNESSEDDSTPKTSEVDTESEQSSDMNDMDTQQEISQKKVKNFYLKEAKKRKYDNSFLNQLNDLIDSSAPKFAERLSRIDKKDSSPRKLRFDESLTKGECS